MTGKFTPGRKLDHVIHEIEDAAGGIERVELTLDQAAAMQRGEMVGGYGISEYLSAADRIAGLRARQDQIAAEMDDLAAEHPRLREGD